MDEKTDHCPGGPLEPKARGTDPPALPQRMGASSCSAEGLASSGLLRSQESEGGRKGVWGAWGRAEEEDVSLGDKATMGCPTSLGRMAGRPSLQSQNLTAPWAPRGLQVPPPPFRAQRGGAGACLAPGRRRPALGQAPGLGPGRAGPRRHLLPKASPLWAEHRHPLSAPAALAPRQALLRLVAGL